MWKGGWKNIPCISYIFAPGRVLGLSKAVPFKGCTSAVAVGHQVLPAPSPSRALAPARGLQPATNFCICTDHRKGQELNMRPRLTEFANSSSPRGSALCHRLLYLCGDKRKGILARQRGAALPCHPAAKPRRSQVATHFAHSFAVIINPD